MPFTSTLLYLEIIIFYLEYIFVVGSEDDHAKTELFYLSSGRWRIKADYPFHYIISRAPSIFINDQFFVFGGYVVDTDVGGYVVGTTKPGQYIAGFNPSWNKWTKMGELKEARYGHNVIQARILTLNK